MCQKITVQGPISAVDPLNKYNSAVVVLAVAFCVWSSCLAQSHQELQTPCTEGKSYLNFLIILTMELLNCFSDY